MFYSDTSEPNLTFLLSKAIHHTKLLSSTDILDSNIQISKIITVDEGLLISFDWPLQSL